jgi:hypothetical protein
MCPLYKNILIIKIDLKILFISWFQAIKRINSNKMKILFLLAIFTSSSAIVINCKFDNKSFSQLDSFYACAVTSLEIKFKRIITKVNGNHLHGKTNKDVKTLFFEEFSEITFIPRGIENFFPNIFALGFDLCNITQLNAEDLKPLKNLEWFSIERNFYLERIPSKFFANNPKLKALWFSHNNIKHVGVNLLDSLSHLRWVNFVNNPCVNKFATFPSDLIELKEILKINCPDV